MAGHSKWKNIQHRKGRQDAVKGKVFTKLIRAITVAARKGGADINSNSNLRLAVDKALGQNMPRDTIDRAIKRGAGDEDGSSNVEEIFYEGYGASGVAVLIECLTDNRNRTIAEVRHAFTKCGGNLGGGSVAYLFKKQGIFTFAPGGDESKIMEMALDSGADDVITNDDGSVDVLTSAENFTKVKDAIHKANLHPEQAELGMTPTIEVPITDHETAEKIIRLVDMLEELDDVQNVYHNASIDEKFYGKG